MILKVASSSHRALSELFIPDYGVIPVLKGDFNILPDKIQAKIMTPKSIYICDGSLYEFEELTEYLECLEYYQKLNFKDKTKEIESDDFERIKPNIFFTTKIRPISSAESRSSVTAPKIETTNSISLPPNQKDKNQRQTTLEMEPQQWMSVHRLQLAVHERFTACMRGRILYVVPTSIGPVGAYFSKNAVQLTDNPHVVVQLHTRARVNYAIWDVIGDSDFVKGVHTVGLPRPVTVKLIADRPLNTKKMFVGQYVDGGEIWTFGSTLINLNLIEKINFVVND